MKRNKIILGISLLLIFLTIFANKFVFIREIKEVAPQDILRLHVIANSNSPADQLLKRQVRNELIKVGNKLFKDISNPKQAQSVVADNLAYLKEVIEKKIDDENYNYKVQLQLDNFKFPTRSYDSLTLAKGKYEALRVEIGSAQGANWWCVLFPPLCFVDSVDKMPSQMINKGQSKRKMQVKFKFKFAEYLQENPELVKEKFNLAKLFNLKE